MVNSNSKIPHILSIAGTDPTGAAGIAIDIITANYFNVKSSIAITAINVQNKDKVSHIEYCNADLLTAQIDCAIKSNKIKAIKVGMIGSIDNAKNLQSYITAIPTILDPVLIASSGYNLCEDKLPLYIRKLAKYTKLITPNIDELAILTQSTKATNLYEAIEQAKHLDCPAILIKAGHFPKEIDATDILIQQNKEIIYYPHKRLNKTKRGTGCALSSAIAANIAKGKSLENSIAIAKNYITKYLCTIRSIPIT